MRTPRQIYAEYNIMPSLGLHQLRAAAVGKLICESISIPVNEKDVILACLFHDMGNIIKSDPAIFPDFVESRGTAYWQKVKDEILRKYGSDSHNATVTMCREIGLPESVIGIIDGIRFSHAEKIRDHGSWELKICEYADLRVGPRGVLPMKDRIDEAKKRYAQKAGFDMSGPREDNFAKLLNACIAIEKQLEEIGFNPKDATDASIAPIVEEFWDYPMEVEWGMI